MSHLTAAVIGTGFIGPIHVEGLKRAGIPVAGILGSNAKKSRTAAVELGLPIGYESLDQLLADSSVDVVHITSPNRYHFQQARGALAAGKHVLCEKPLAMNSDESAKLLQLGRESGLATGVNYNIRYYPLCVEAADQVRGGQLGDLFHVTGSYSQDWLFHDTDFNWRLLSDEGGQLRAIADIGTHWLDLIQHICGRKVESVLADLATVYPKRRRPSGPVEAYGKPDESVPTETIDITTEDYGGVMLRFAGGTRGMMWVSQVTAGRKNCLRFEIAGSKQSLYFDTETPNQIRVGHRDAANQVLMRDPALVGDRARAAISYPGGHNEGFGETFKQLFRDFYRSIAAGNFTDSEMVTFPSFADGHHEIQVCEAILQSHREQRWITIGE